MSHKGGKWATVVRDLQATPGEWKKVADNASPSTIQRLKELGVLVKTDIVAPRTGQRTYDRYTVQACWPTPEQEQELEQETATPEQLAQSTRVNSKWTKVVDMLKADPGEWHKVADDAGPSTIQRLRELGAEVIMDSLAPRTDGATYSRYEVHARWPTPTTQLEQATLELDKVRKALATAKADMLAAEDEYNADKKRLNRSSYRRKQAREKYQPLLEQHDHLALLLNRLKTEKD